MSSAELTPDVARRPLTGRRARFGDLLLQVVAGAAAAAATVLVLLIAWKVVEGARPAIAKFGLHFVTHVAWNPVVGREVFGAASFLFGTAITSLFALALATPLAIGCALFLTELAPRVLRAPVTSLVETLAAIPSVVIGLWGISCSARFSSATSSRRCTARSASFRSSVRASSAGLEHLHRDRRADDDDPADRLEHQPRALPRRAARAEGRRARTRDDPLGDGARRRLSLCARRNRGSADPRARASGRRGDRRDTGDRRRRVHPLEPLRDRRHAREQDRVLLSGRERRISRSARSSISR